MIRISGKTVRLIVRNLCTGDLAAAAEIERKSFSSPWSRQAFDDALNNPNTCCLAAVLISRDGRSEILAGYCILYCAVDAAEIADIAVDEAFRGCGIADALMNHVKKRMPALSLQVLHLDVRPSNEAALGLYIKHRFVKDGYRRDFYRNPREDALLMSFSLTGREEEENPC